MLISICIWFPNQLIYSVMYLRLFQAIYKICIKIGVKVLHIKKLKDFSRTVFVVLGYSY
jgi:hypothetical protein